MASSGEIVAVFCFSFGPVNHEEGEPNELQTFIYEPFLYLFLIFFAHTICSQTV